MSLFWSHVCVWGFVGWIASAFLLIWQGFTKDGELVTKKAFIWGILIVIFYALWVVGMRFA
ncbi:hypothetical protein KKB18_13275 [bacterium]|nr:hypothetical protein [bacterium]